MPAKRNRDVEEEEIDEQILQTICRLVPGPPGQPAQLCDEANIDSQSSIVEHLKELWNKKDRGLVSLIGQFRNLESEKDTANLIHTVSQVAGFVFNGCLGGEDKVKALVQYVRDQRAKLPKVEKLFGEFPTVIVNWVESIGDGALNRLTKFGKGKHIDGVFSGEVDGIDGKDKTRVTVISGESGAGKTHFSLTRDSAALTLYCPVPEDVCQDEGTPVIEEIKRVLATAGDFHLVATEYPVIRIVFDEAGGNPLFLRKLCRHGQTLIKDLEKLWKSDTRSVEVRLLAVGTGSETVTGQPGSSPDTFKLVRLSSQADSADKFLAELPEGARKGANELLKHFGVFKVLMQNARIACILCILFQNHFSDNSLQTDVMNSAPNIISQATVQYRESNGLSDLTDIEDISMWCRLAVRICIENPGKELPDSIWETLVVRYGLITDNQMRLSEQLYRRHHEKYDLIGKDEVDENGTKIKIMVVLPKNILRYSMSDAISLVVASRLGLPVAVSSSTSGEPMEKTTLSKLMLLLATECSVQVAHSHLQLDLPPGGHFNTRKLQKVKHVLLPKRLSRANAVDGKVTDWFPEPVRKMIATLEPMVDNGETVLIRNVAGAPYADIIVLAKGLLWLVQVKDVSSMSAIAFNDERAKILFEFHEGKKQESQITKELSRITEAEPRVLFFARGKENEVPKASGETFIPDDDFKRNFYQALTKKTASVISTESSLFLPPMCWPLASQDVPLKVLQGQPLKSYETPEHDEDDPPLFLADAED